VATIEDQATRLKAIVDDLLVLSDLERPDAALVRAPVDLAKSARAVTEALVPREHHHLYETIRAEGPLYNNGFAGYPGANTGTTIDLTTGYPDTVWCWKSSPTATERQTAEWMAVTNSSETQVEKDHQSGR
jgi:signal transduction histidine kinase